MRQVFRRVQNIAPFVVLLLLYFSYQHKKGIFVFIVGTAAIVALDQRFRAQVAMKDKASIWALLAIICICVIDAIAICSISRDNLTPYITILLRNVDSSKARHVDEILWVVMVNGMCI
jgi:hypothetical protein